MSESDRWKVANSEGLIPPVSFYQSDRVAARAEAKDDHTVTIVAWDTDSDRGDADG